MIRPRDHLSIVISFFAPTRCLVGLKTLCSCWCLVLIVFVIAVLVKSVVPVSAPGSRHATPGSAGRWLWHECRAMEMILASVALEYQVIDQRIFVALITMTTSMLVAL